MVNLKLSFPDGFFDEEVRCDYTVSKAMKEIWAVEMDLLSELLRVCRKHNINVMVAGGTALGVVRHEGFIPWDDDIDLIMYRDDYNKLCSVADEFSHPYFFQTEYTDRGSLTGHAQLRNSETTAVFKKNRNKLYSFNQGIFIDIFPMDAVVDNKFLLAIQQKEAGFLKNKARAAARFSTRYVEEKATRTSVFIHKYFSKFFDRLSLWCYKRFEKVCQRYNKKDSKAVSLLSFAFGDKRLYRLRKNYTEVIEMPFEFIKVPITKEYDECLRMIYGNYMEFVKGTSYHGEVIFDTNRSYKEFTEEMRKMKQSGK